MISGETKHYRATSAKLVIIPALLLLAFFVSIFCVGSAVEEAKTSESNHGESQEQATKPSVHNSTEQAGETAPLQQLKIALRDWYQSKVRPFCDNLYHSAPLQKWEKDLRDRYQFNVIPFCDKLYHSIELAELHLKVKPGTKNFGFQFARAIFMGFFLWLAAQVTLYFFWGVFARWWCLKRHVVIIGLNETSFALIKMVSHKMPKGPIKSFYLMNMLWRSTVSIIWPERGKGPEKIIVVYSEEDNPWLDKCTELGVQTLLAPELERKDMSAARIRKAEHVFFVENSDEENLHNATRALDKMGKTSHGCKFYLHIGDASLRTVLTRHPKFEDKGKDKPTVTLFNTLDRISELSIRKEVERTYTQRAIDLKPGSTKQPHCVIMGLGKVGSFLLLHAMRTACFGNSVPSKSGAKDAVAPRFTVIESNQQVIDDFLTNHPELRPEARDVPHRTPIYAYKDGKIEKDGGIEGSKRIVMQAFVTLQDLLLPEVNFVCAEIGSAHAARVLADILENDNAIRDVFVCLGSDALSLGAAVNLENSLPKKKCKGVRIHVWDNADSDTRKFLGYGSGEGNGKGDGKSVSWLPDSIRLFGMVDIDCGLQGLAQEDWDRVARNIHNHYACPYGGDDWQKLSENLRETNRNAAAHIPIKLATIGLEIAQRPPDETFGDWWPLLGNGKPCPLTNKDGIACGRKQGVGCAFSKAAFDSIKMKFLPIAPAISTQGSAEDEEDVIELLAQLEHRRWNVDKILSGYLPGERDDLRRYHNLLLPWDQLPDPERQKDREAIYGIPKFVFADAVCKATNGETEKKIEAKA